MDEKRLAELKALAEGSDHIDLRLEGMKHVALDCLPDPEAHPQRYRRTITELNPKTIALIAAARTAVPELVEEVRRLRDATDPGVLREIVLAARRVGRERSVAVARAFAKKAGDDGQEMMAEEIADAIDALPDE